MILYYIHAGTVYFMYVLYVFNSFIFTFIISGRSLSGYVQNDILCIRHTFKRDPPMCVRVFVYVCVCVCVCVWVCMCARVCIVIGSIFTIK